MRRLLDQYKSSNTTTEQRLSILLELEYLVHQVPAYIAAVKIEILGSMHTLYLEMELYAATVMLCVVGG